MTPNQNNKPQLFVYNKRSYNSCFSSRKNRTFHNAHPI